MPSRGELSALAALGYLRLDDSLLFSSFSSPEPLPPQRAGRAREGSETGGLHLSVFNTAVLGTAPTALLCPYQAVLQAFLFLLSPQCTVPVIHLFRR